MPLSYRLLNDIGFIHMSLRNHAISVETISIIFILTCHFGQTSIRLTYANLSSTFQIWGNPIRPNNDKGSNGTFFTGLVPSHNHPMNIHL